MGTEMVEVAVSDVEKADTKTHDLVDENVRLRLAVQADAEKDAAIARALKAAEKALAAARDRGDAQAAAALDLVWSVRALYYPEPGEREGVW